MNVHNASDIASDFAIFIAAFFVRNVVVLIGLAALFFVALD